MGILDVDNPAKEIDRLSEILAELETRVRLLEISQPPSLRRRLLSFYKRMHEHGNI